MKVSVTKIASSEAQPNSQIEVEPETRSEVEAVVQPEVEPEVEQVIEPEPVEQVNEEVSLANEECSSVALNDGTDVAAPPSHTSG